MIKVAALFQPLAGRGQRLRYSEIQIILLICYIKITFLPPPAKRGIMRNEFRQPDEQNMRQLLHQHPEDLPGLILRPGLASRAQPGGDRRPEMGPSGISRRGVLFLEDRTVPLEEETAGCLAARFENGGAVSPYVVISDKFREPLRPESVSRIARNALTVGGLPQLQLKDLRRDYFFPPAGAARLALCRPGQRSVGLHLPSLLLPGTPRTKAFNTGRAAIR